MHYENQMCAKVYSVTPTREVFNDVFISNLQKQKECSELLFYHLHKPVMKCLVLKIYIDT